MPRRATLPAARRPSHPTRIARPRTPEERARMQRVYRRRRFVAVGLVVAVLGSAWWVSTTVAGAVRPLPVEVKGLRDGQLSGAAAAAPEIRVPQGATSVKVDGVELVGSATPDGGRLLVRPPALAEGKHTFAVRVGRRLRPDRSRSLTVKVDASPPAVSVQPVAAVEIDQKVVVEGSAEKDATVRVGTAVADVKDGAYRIELPPPAPAEVVVVATDTAGNEATARVPVPTIQPRTRAVHLSALGWVTPGLRDPILDLLAERRINAIQLDVKDEGGEVGHTTTVPTAREVGAAKDLFVLKDAVDDIHRRGGRVIGRIVALRDPKLAQASWDAGHKEDLVQSADGERFGAYGGGFLSSGSQRVRDYTTALAVEAAEAGVDDVLLDYIRRPDGDLEGMVFPGLEDGPGEEKAVEEAVVKQVAELHGKVRAAGARLGASVYGIAASRPAEIAQDVPALARNLDFMSPMLYPSHWAKGEYGIADPNRSPGEITQKSLVDFGEAVDGAPASLVPWFQDFTLGITYGEKEVRAQIEGAADLGVKDFLLWDAQCTYTGAALDPMEQ